MKLQNLFDGEKMNYFEQNVKYIEKYHLDLKMALEMNKDESKAYGIDFLKSMGEWKVPCIRTERGDYRLNSIYAPKVAAKYYADRYTENCDYKVFAIMGFADGCYIREMLKRINDTNLLIIYEPNISYMKAVLVNYDISDILMDKRVALAVGRADNGMLENQIARLVDYGRKDQIVHCILPGYDMLYAEECTYYIELLIQRMKWLTYQKNSFQKMNHEFLENLFENASDMLKAYTVNQLIRACQNYDLSEIPAIVVSAGPSLDKNVHLLKRAKGKAMIVAVDTAASRLMKENIEPDLVITVDSHVGGTWADTEWFKKLNLVLMPMSSVSLVRKNKGKHFYSSVCYPYIQKFYLQANGENVLFLDSGGSVSNDAFSLVRLMGFETIVLIGQDLAFTGGRSYTQGIKDDEQENQAYIGRRKLVTVKSIHGEDLQTDVQMDEYRRWFEREFKKYPKMKVIDATEGGAYIEGTIISTLENVINQYCQNTFDINEEIKNMLPIFDEKQQEEIKTELKGIPKQLEELKELFAKGIQYYNELKVLKQLADSPRYMQLMSQIAEVDKIIATDLLIDILSLYNIEECYETDDVAYSSENVSVEELANQGIRLLKSYIQAANDMQKDIQLMETNKQKTNC